jgi:hypothetical protein
VAQKWVLKFRPSSALLKNPPGVDPDGHSRVARTVGMNALYTLPAAAGLPQNIIPRSILWKSGKRAILLETTHFCFLQFRFSSQNSAISGDCHDCRQFQNKNDG